MHSFSVRQSSAAKQFSVGSAEISVEGWIQDGVKGRVKIAQPQDHRGERVRGCRLFLYAHVGEEGEVGKPADDEGPQNGRQRHRGFVLSRCSACKRWRGGADAMHLRAKLEKRREEMKDVISTDCDCWNSLLQMFPLKCRGQIIIMVHIPPMMAH